MVNISEVDDEYRQIYSCELCNNKTYPTLVFPEAKKRDASIGPFSIRKQKMAGEETGRSVYVINV